jgi:Holliday junction resolvase-like predicted endonuclease
VNTRQQGDLGEASAIEWLVRAGATVFVPLNHAPDVDLVAELDGELLRVQVKTSGYARGGRFPVAIATRGGNQSWSGMTKRFAASRCDRLFVLLADGRRWFIPATAVEGTVGIVLGGPKYAEYEIERGLPFGPPSLD